MLIRVGYVVGYVLNQPTAMVFMANLHDVHADDTIIAEKIAFSPDVPVRHYVDLFGNKCMRVLAPAGEIRIVCYAVVQDSGVPEIFPVTAKETPITDLPDEALVYLMPSRFCESDLLMQAAWDLFGNTEPGWARVFAISSFANQRIAFDYAQARPTKSALDAYNERQGVCRDYAHLTIALCRAMNIPARYVSGYLSDIGVPPRPPMDFSGWSEVFLDGAWHTVDARSNFPRIGRYVIARGRDAGDVAFSTSFGPALLSHFEVWTDEITALDKDTVPEAFAGIVGVHSA